MKVLLGQSVWLPGQRFGQGHIPLQVKPCLHRHPLGRCLPRSAGVQRLQQAPRESPAHTANRQLQRRPSPCAQQPRPYSWLLGARLRPAVTTAAGDTGASAGGLPHAPGRQAASAAAGKPQSASEPADQHCAACTAAPTAMTTAGDTVSAGAARDAGPLLAAGAAGKAASMNAGASAGTARVATPVATTVASGKRHHVAAEEGAGAAAWARAESDALGERLAATARCFEERHGGYSRLYECARQPAPSQPSTPPPPARCMPSRLLAPARTCRLHAAQLPGFADRAVRFTTWVC